MIRNVGTADRIIRIIIGTGIVVYGLMNRNWIGAIGLIPILTGVIGFCPLYYPLKINTNKN